MNKVSAVENIPEVASKGRLVSALTESVCIY